MVNVPSGTTSSDNGNIRLDYDIEMGKYEVTHLEYIEFLNDAAVAADGFYEETKLINMEAIKHDGSSFYFAGSDYAESEDCPVIEVSWYGALAYCNWLSEQDGLTPAYDLSSWELIREDEFTLEGYRLPTKDEWKYAARGGDNGNATTYAGSDNIDDVAWYIDNSDGKTHPVGKKQANELGIYDMSGNIEEWTNTTQGPCNKYTLGGSYGSVEGSCEVTFDGRYATPDSSLSSLGFRLTKTK